MQLYNQGAITYNEANKQRIYVFVTGDDKHLHANYWDGSVWRWAHQGTPPGTTVAGPPSVITYREGTQPQRIYAFVQGANGHLFVNYWDGSNWNWADQGTPPGTTGVSIPGVITFLEGNKQLIYAFVLGSNGRLYVNYWNGSQWKWADQGTPPDTLLDSSPAVITYREGTQPQQIYAFLEGANSNLFVNYWDGSLWKWADRGRPDPTGLGLDGAPAVVTYREGTEPQRIYAFVRGQIDELYVNYRVGSEWKWAKQGVPKGLGSIGVAKSSGVISYLEAGKQRIYAFVTLGPAANPPNTLNVNYWDGSDWRWADLGHPPGEQMFSGATPAVITYREGTQPQRIYAFVKATDGHLHVCYWDGSDWRWADQGAPA